MVKSSASGWEKRLEADPEGSFKSIAWKLVFFAIAVVVVVSVIGYGLGWFSEAARVAQEEFGPRAALQKYEWFINQAASIEKMDKDVVMFDGRVKSVDAQYKTYGDDRAKWPPHIAIQFNRERQQAREDLIAVASQRNNLVREYNSASEKFNWKLFQSRPDKPKERFHDYEVK